MSKYSSTIYVICKNSVTILWLLWVTNWSKLTKLNVFSCYFALKEVTNCSIFLFKILKILSINKILWFAKEWRVYDCCYFLFTINASYFWGIYWVNFYKNVKQLLKRQMCFTAILLPLIFYIFKAFFYNIIYFVKEL